MMSNKTELNLLPCPFCGGEAELITWQEHTEARHIRCKECGCMTGKPHFSRQFAFLDWNTRPTEQESKWVSVEDRLPENHLEVDVECAGFVNPEDTPTETSVGFIGGEGKWVIASWLCEQDCYETLHDVIVTRWKHREIPPSKLPEPPEKEQGSWLKDSNTHCNKQSEEKE